MPNFPLPLGRGANANVCHRLRADSVPKFAFSPRMSWSAKVSHSELMSQPSSQGIALTVTNDDDGDHVLTFSGGGLAEPVVLDAFAASGDTVDDIAAGLEAIIEAARATDEPLEGIVTGETVSTDTISIVGATLPIGTPPLVVTLTVDDVDAEPELEYTYQIVLTPGLTRNATQGHTEFLFDEFPEDVVRSEAVMRVHQAFAGVTAITVLGGDEGAADGLLTSSSLASIATLSTVAAAEYPDAYEAAFIPQLTVTAVSASALSFQSLTAGEFDWEIAYNPCVVVP